MTNSSNSKSLINEITENQMDIPDAVKQAQQQGYPLKVDTNELPPSVKLFFSFDIVNSTVYKTNTAEWPVIIKGFLSYIRRCVQRENDLEGSFLWRVIGDEMVFVYPISSKDELYLAVDAIFRITQRVSLSIHTGKFFETLEEQSLERREIAVLKNQDVLSVKAAAWIAAITQKISTPYDTIQIEYPADASNMPIIEYLGRDMDIGFRLKAYTQRRRLVVSFELAYLLNDFLKDSTLSNCLNIIGYEKLKGVWNDSLYPIIWYYDDNTVSEVWKSLGLSGVAPKFKDSFYYDEMVGNELVQHFLARTRFPSDNKDLIEPAMYKIDNACSKICNDKNLHEKLKYLKETMESGPRVTDRKDYVFPLQLHCAVVCCDTQRKAILIARRGSNHLYDCEKWDFGCAKADGNHNLVERIKEAYRNFFGVDIDLVMDTGRKDSQPIPLAVYEIPAQNDHATKKGIIFVAKVKNPSIITKYRENPGHSSVKWLTEDRVATIKANEAITDFHNTVNKVFSKWVDFFGGEAKHDK